jgi:hypothetical protein
MTVFPPREPRPPEEYTDLHPDVGLFSRVEGLIGEEHALLAIPAQERSEAQHRRLRDIGAELDRVFDRLRERHERRMPSDRPAT